MIIVKNFPRYDPNFFGPPWGCAVTLRNEMGREGELMLAKSRGKLAVDRHGNIQVTVTTSQRFVAFGQMNLRTGVESQIFYELAELHWPVEVSEEHVRFSLVVYEWRRLKKDWFKGMENHILIDELEARGFTVRANKHKMKEIS